MSKNTEKKHYGKVFAGTVITLLVITGIFFIFIKIAAAFDNSNSTTSDQGLLNTVSDTFRKINIINPNKKLKDKTPPVITGVSDITIYVDEIPDFFFGVSVTDDSNENITIHIDSSAANYNTPGIYPITYSASDSTGNTTVETCYLYVEELPKASEKRLQKLSKAILDKIITPDMSKYQIAQNIYNFCGSITYSNYKSCYINDELQYDMFEAARMGIEDKKGDCFCFAASAYMLLKEAGIDVELIEAYPLNGRHHFFNLINIGYGWYYFDSCWFNGKTRDLFYLTQEEIDLWDAKNYPNRHSFDSSQTEVTIIDKQADKITEEQ